MKCEYWAAETEDMVPGEIGCEVTDADEVQVTLGPVGEGEQAHGYLSGLKAIELGQRLIAAGAEAVTAQVAKVRESA